MKAEEGKQDAKEAASEKVPDVVVPPKAISAHVERYVSELSLISVRSIRTHSSLALGVHPGEHRYPANYHP